MSPRNPRITKVELESKFQSLQDDLQGKVTDNKQKLVAGLSIGASVIVLIAYLLGRRGGRKRRSVVEIRR